MARIILPDDVKKMMNGIHHFKLVFTDVVGNLKSMNITGKEIWEIIHDGQGFDGSSVRGFVRLEESDLMADVRFKSFRVLPASLSDNGKPFGIFFCDIKTTEGKPFLGDPRQCLKRAIRKARQKKFEFFVGPELEFFIFADQYPPKTLDDHGYFDAENGEIGSTVTQEVADTLDEIGIHVECWHHEVAPSQFEIDVKYQNALTMADQVMLIKWIIKRVAQKHGVIASFMPKPIFGENGSGMHTHMSLFKNGRNAFFDRRHQFNLSAIAKQFSAGLLFHIEELTLVTNPRINSYKRLVPGYEAPVYASWGQRNRSSLLRVPGYRQGKEQATRVELRSPDPSCNPYLAFAAMLSAGLDGMSQGLKLCAPVEENIFHMTAGERIRRGIRTLPGSLEEAILYAEKSDFLKATLGPHIYTALLENERSERDAYRIQVTPWEHKNA